MYIYFLNLQDIVRYYAQIAACRQGLEVLSLEKTWNQYGRSGQAQAPNWTHLKKAQRSTWIFCS